jgi:hypothetical protein
MRRAANPNHPLHIDAVAALRQMRATAEGRSWESMGIAAGHPARNAYYANPNKYGGQPSLAVDSWEAAESRKEKAVREAAAKAAADKEAEERRNASPGMPSRSVSTASSRGGKKVIPWSEYQSRITQDPSLIDQVDAGKAVIDYGA